MLGATVRIAAIGLSAALIAVSLSTFGQSGGNYEIIKSTVDGGGGESSSGQYSMTGTAGQPEASSQLTIGGDFMIAGGFWAIVFFDLIFENGFEEP